VVSHASPIPAAGTIRRPRCWKAGNDLEKEDIMTSLGKTLAGAALGAGLLAVTSVGASAAIACKRRCLLAYP